MSSAVSSLTYLLPHTASAAATPAPVSPPGDPLANEQTFLKLLVSQLQNQDPLNPTDSNQFVSQLTSYSQLEQLIGIRQNTAPADPITPPATSTTPPTAAI